jgi:hypothetical protein
MNALCFVSILVFGVGIGVSVAALPAQSLQWTQSASLTGPIEPGAGIGPNSIAEDPVRNVVVLFTNDGAGGPVLPHDWDGEVWRLRPATIAGQYRIAYDTARQRIVAAGGNTLSSACWAWNGTTSAFTSLQPPMFRDQSALAYDELRDRVILFGGSSGFNTVAVTERFDGTQWISNVPAHEPSPRIGHAMAYDPARARIVLFGGGQQGSPVTNDETWEWDGADWQQQSPAVRPPARLFHAMTFDHTRGCTLLVGGQTSNSGLGVVLGDTWQWDGSFWTQVASAGLPVPVADRNRRCMLADHRALQTCVFVRGALTYLWDGAEWRRAPLAMPNGIGPCAYDRARDRAVLALPGDGVDVVDTWEWDGARWLLRATGQPFPTGGNPLQLSVMAYDAARRRTLLCNSMNVLGVPAQLWEWDGTAWTQRITATALPPLIGGAAMAWDAARAVAVLVNSNQTWEYDGVDWRSRVSFAVPPARTDMAFAYDVQRQVCVLFGGSTAFATWAGDTWEWDGVQWARRFPSVSPSPREGRAMAYDESRQRIVLVGGTDGSGVLQDAWEWDGTTWSPQAAPAGLDASGTLAMVYDAQRARLLLRDTAHTFAGDVPGTAVAIPFGAGCGTPPLTLTAVTRPVLGQQQTLEATNVGGPFAVVMFGWSSNDTNGQILPLSLAGLGMPGCELVQSLEVTAPCQITAPGIARYSWPVPNAAQLVGLHLFVQTGAPAPGQNAAGVVVSNGVSLFVGNH